MPVTAGLARAVVRQVPDPPRGLIHTRAMGRGLGFAAAGALLGSLVVGGAAPSYASCAQDSGPDGAQVIFVGTADGERRGFTHFSVTEVWAGPDLSPGVWVLSGQRQPRWPFNLFSAVGSSVDAHFVDGGRYVVGASRQFETSACSVDEVPSGRTAPGRPTDVRAPTSQAPREPTLGSDQWARP